MKLNLSGRLTSEGDKSAVSSSDVTDIPMLRHQRLLPGKTLWQERLGITFTANVNLYPVIKTSLYLSFSVHSVVVPC